MNDIGKVDTGLDALAATGFSILRNARIGMLAAAATVDRNIKPIVRLLGEAGIRIKTIFGPEHGFYGIEQDLIGIADGTETFGGERIVSLYGTTVDSLRPRPEQLADLDLILIDLPDVGSRYYTFQASMLKCLEAAASAGLRVVVLDRPNPLGGDTIEGPIIQPGFESFVGEHAIPIRHGLTLGELARLYVAERKLQCDLQVIPCSGWKRSMSFEETGLPWVLPSPNMPALETARVYPGQCLLEGTNLSEGRGTTRPFEICGAPWIDKDRLLGRLEARKLPGVVFRPIHFRPTFQKFAGTTCAGVQIHVTDHRAFQPVRASLCLLHALRLESLEQFQWRTATYEFVSDKPAIDLLFGSDRERKLLEAGADADAIAANWTAEETAFRERRKAYLLYE
jgi:uncharacterized protein YbbC (DUF1343 family)